MALQQLSLETLGDLDGGHARAIIDAALQAAVRDLDDRGNDEKPRKVTIEIEMVKKEGLTLIRATAIPKVPTFSTGVTTGKLSIGPRGQSILGFQELSPDDPDQQALPYTDK
jgi:hypothetical protein